MLLVERSKKIKEMMKIIIAGIVTNKLLINTG